MADSSTWNGGGYYIQPQTYQSNNTTLSYGINTNAAASITFKYGDSEATIDMHKPEPKTEIDRLLSEVEGVCCLAR